MEKRLAMVVDKDMFTSILNISILIQAAKSSCHPWNNGVNFLMKRSKPQACAIAEMMPPEAIGELGEEA